MKEIFSNSQAACLRRIAFGADSLVRQVADQRHLVSHVVFVRQKESQAVVDGGPFFSHRRGASINEMITLAMSKLCIVMVYYYQNDIRYVL
jgi:hypothetical protein